ncbi:MAG TPA: response regulator [Candidatus Acidoferrales bacterium]|nr:response regulator [Candidatus Acidoferrales bacterium]
MAAAKILIVDDDPDTQRVLGYTLKQEGFDVLVAVDGAEALKVRERDRPDLILLDIMLPKLDGYQVAERIRADEGSSGHVPIVMVTAETDIEQKVRGLRAGADDYLVKPFHPAELLARIRSLLARFAPRNVESAGPAAAAGRVLAFYGAKGGVGTTTLAINAAIALQRDQGRRVVLVDGNLQFGDHRVFLDLGLDRKSIVDVVVAPSIDQDLLKSVLIHHDTGIDLLLAPPSPETAELVKDEQHHMSQIIELLRQRYDYVIVDIDKRLDETNLDVIAAANVVFVVMTADLSCLKNVRLVLETMSQLGIGPGRVQLVLNRSTAYTGITVKNAESALRRRIAHQVVNDYRVAITALNTGAPFAVTRTDSVLGKSVVEFVRHVDKLDLSAAESAEFVPATT